MNEEEDTDTQTTEKVDHVSEENDDVASHCTSEPSASALEIMFSDRYTAVRKFFSSTSYVYYGY